MFENLKSWLEKLTFLQCVFIFAILATLRLWFFPVLDITFFEENWVATVSLTLAFFVFLFRILVRLQIKPFAQRLLALASLLLAIIFLSNYRIYSPLLVLGFYLLRFPLANKYKGFGWKLEFPLGLALLANIWLGQTWLVISILVLLILNESFGDRLKKVVSSK